MEELEKLKKLVEHWKEHNEEHLKSYKEWAAKAESMGNKELAETLAEIVKKSEKIDKLLKRASKSAK